MTPRLLTWILIPLAISACRAAESSPAATSPPLSAVEALAGGDPAGGDEGYRKALEPRVFSFPDDHGPHPDFRSEWWYFTGHLEGDGGRRFGYQLTFFRQALAPDMPERPSSWATRQAYLGHFALSDVEGGRLHAFERLSRGAGGLAGAGGRPFQVWIEDWSVQSIGDQAFPVRLQARDGDLALDLVLENQKPPVFHGEQGLSRKGETPGNASYYYSLTRLGARGRVTLDGREIPVTGSSWLDREWSTSVLGKEQVGWDWFSLQLDDGRELMVYQMRLEDGGVDPSSHGTLVAVDGTLRALEAADYRIEATGTWRSPRGATYPAGWRLQVAPEGRQGHSAPDGVRPNLKAGSLVLEIEPLFADQELDVSFRYWEGAVDAYGTAGGEPVSGRGYVELVGYGDKR